MHDISHGPFRINYTLFNHEHAGSTSCFFAIAGQQAYRVAGLLLRKRHRTNFTSLDISLPMTSLFSFFSILSSSCLLDTTLVSGSFTVVFVLLSSFSTLIP